MEKRKIEKEKRSRHVKKYVKKIGIFVIFGIILLSLFSFTFSQESELPKVKVCCEKTKYGAWCQNDYRENCDENYRINPSSCESSSFCRKGCCYDSIEGICMENTPQRVCDVNEGTWSESPTCEIPQCELGCCILGTQASFVTLTRCKRLSSLYGLITDFRRDITNELDCIEMASLSDKGACVFELDYVKTCKVTTRQECNSLKEKGSTEEGEAITNVEFYKDLLCSAEELGTNCGPTKETMCVEGKDEVYFKDSCGNPANIYDASKVNDKAYWRKIVPKSESCGAGNPNINSRSCGNCDYLAGSICKSSKEAGVKPEYGNYICADLNCHETSDGKAHLHGESWCSTDEYPDTPGSRYFRHICLYGEEIIEPCADFRNEVCEEATLETARGSFSQAGCVVNRWQDCILQTTKDDCENSDERDCKWIEERESIEPNETIACVPIHPPGMEFWKDEAEGSCNIANTQCVMKIEKGLVGQKDVKNKNCDKDSWLQAQLNKCQLIGDCGATTNYLGIEPDEGGYEKIVDKKD